jgi:hypothetical protein
MSCRERRKRNAYRIGEKNHEEDLGRWEDSIKIRGVSKK